MEVVYCARHAYPRLAHDYPTTPLPRYPATMLTSVRWMNDYLDPQASDAEQGDLLTAAGFPLEERIERDDDIALDFEMMSNRGDCTCHLGLAREIAAISGRSLVLPDSTVTESDDPIGDHVTVVNEEPDACPLYTARVIRGVNVTPSPKDIAQRLETRGDIPRNVIVDASNFVLFEMGQPTHAFDLDTLAGETIIIRMARKGETFLPLGEGATPITLTGEELVIADAEKPVALAGVKGGAASAVTEKTTNILLEAATFDPVLVRSTSRLHGISSDSSFRFERGVSPLQVDACAQRLASLVLEHAGGTLCKGVLSAGVDLPPLREVSMRMDRCRSILGRDIPAEEMVQVLDTLGFNPTLEGDSINVTVPCERGDIEREIDLVEEVARMQGYNDLPVNEVISTRPASAQPRVLGRRALDAHLVAEGFMETVTHSLINETAATPFLPGGTSLLGTIDEREGGDTILRPSLLPSLLRVRAHNQDQGAGTMRLFEGGSVFHATKKGHDESLHIGLLMDFVEPADGLRPLLGVIERLACRLQGSSATIESTPSTDAPWFEPGALLRLGGSPIGRMGLLAGSIRNAHGLEHDVMGAELCLRGLLAGYPPVADLKPLPAFPAIERDISAIVQETATWQELAMCINGLDLALLESVDFVTTWRGEQVGSDRKSITLRLCFRDAKRTLTHDEVDGPVQQAIDALESTFQAEIRN